MISFKVRVFGYIRDIIGSKEIILNAESQIKLSDALKILARKFSRLEKLLYSNGKLNQSIIILVNGISISGLHGLNTTIKDGDTISILPMVSGG